MERYPGAGFRELGVAGTDLDLFMFHSSASAVDLLSKIDIGTRIDGNAPDALSNRRFLATANGQ
jgi:hypothetical protein